MNKRLLILATALIAGLASFALWSQIPKSKREVNDPMSTMPSQETPGQKEAAATPEGDLQVFTLDAKMYSYSPNVIRVKKDDKVKVVINNIDSDPKFEIVHDFALDEFGVKSTEVGEGESGSVEFVADRVGSFEFYCSIGKHREKGQVGTLIVTE